MVEAFLVRGATIWGADRARVSSEAGETKRRDPGGEGEAGVLILPDGGLCRCNGVSELPWPRAWW